MEIDIRIHDPLLRAYLRGLFENIGKTYLVNTDTLTGSVICALVKPCPYQPQNSTSGDKFFIRFRLPNSHYTDELRNKFLYISQTDQAKINMVLQKEFDCNFTVYCVQSRILGLQLKEAIEQFMVVNQMDEFFEGEIETLKKRFYRNEVRAMKKAQEKLRQKAYYNFRKIVQNRSHSRK